MTPQGASALIQSVPADLVYGQSLPLTSRAGLLPTPHPTTLQRLTPTWTEGGKRTSLTPPAPHRSRINAMSSLRSVAPDSTAPTSCSSSLGGGGTAFPNKHMSLDSSKRMA